MEGEAAELPDYEAIKPSVSSSTRITRNDFHDGAGWAGSFLYERFQMDSVYVSTVNRHEDFWFDVPHYSDTPNRLEFPCGMSIDK